MKKTNGCACAELNACAEPMGCACAKLNGCARAEVNGCAEPMGCVCAKLNGCARAELNGCAIAQPMGCACSKMSGCACAEVNGCALAHLMGCARATSWRQPFAPGPLDQPWPQAYDDGVVMARRRFRVTSKRLRIQAPSNTRERLMVSWEVLYFTVGVGVTVEVARYCTVLYCNVSYVEVRVEVL